MLASARRIPALAVETGGGRARRVLMREALAPAEKTADWLARLELAGGRAFVRQGVAGLRLLEAETEDQEAAAIALMLREALERPGGAAVVTPDARLARRIEAGALRRTQARTRCAKPGGCLIALCGLARH